MPRNPAEEVVPVIPDYAQKKVLQQERPTDWTPQLTTDHPTIRLADPSQPIEPSEDRASPYVLRGRHAEFNRLAQLLENPPRAVHLITGPPGSGKSTLLDALKKYARKIGYITVRIEPAWFTNRHNLVAQIREDALGKALRDPQTRQIRTQQGQADIEAGASAVVHASGTINQAQSQTEESEAKGSPVLLKQLEDIIQVLRKHHSHVRGLVLHCDEFQNLDDEVSGNRKLFQTARQHLETLNESFHKDPEQKLPIITMLAGIPPAERTLTRFLTRKSSANVIELLPVDGYPVTDPSSTYCTQILQDYIEHGQAIDGHHLAISASTLHQWGQSCEGHVMHANQAGAIIQKQLHDWHRQGKTKIDDDTDLPIIAQQIQTRRAKYYDERLECPESDADIPDDDVAEEQETVETLLRHLIVAIHTQRQASPPTERPTFLTWRSIQHLSRQLVPTANQRKKALATLVHMGAIRRMRPGDHFARHRYQLDPLDLPYADASIPTMSEHILKPQTVEEIEQIKDTNAKLMQSFIGFTTTQWQWDLTPRPTEITRSHHFQYHPGREPQELTPIEAEQMQRRVQHALANDWSPSMVPRTGEGENRPDWLAVIHAAAPPRKISPEAATHTESQSLETPDNPH